MKAYIISGYGILYQLNAKSPGETLDKQNDMNLDILQVFKITLSLQSD